MKITKIGHCCLVIEEGGVKLLTDPGVWSTGQEDVREVDAVLITHEHPDHLHVESLEGVLKNNPSARVITNTAVSKIVKSDGIECEVVEDGDTTEVSGVLVEGCGDRHADIPNFPPIQVQNTGYFIAERLYYPGDSFHKIGKPVNILALPVAGPWLKISEAIAFAQEIQPEHIFPVHDGMIMEDRIGPFHGTPAYFFEKDGIDFVALKNGDSVEW